MKDGLKGKDVTNGWEVRLLKKGKEYKSKNKLSATQEVLYQREFKRADQAGEYDAEKKRK
jgi:hypothetical protein